MDRDVVVVGGGITGLVLCHELQARETDCVVLEGADRPGGVMTSTEREGRVLDLGPQRTRLTASIADLVDDLDLGHRLLRAPDDLPLYIYRDGRLRQVPFDLATMWHTDLLSWPSKLRLLLEPLSGPPRPGESVAELFTRKFGREAYLHLFGPLYGGIYASDPREMPVRYSLGRALEEHGLSRSIVAGVLRWKRRGGEPPDAVGFDGGMRVLPQALYEEHSDRIRLGEPVTEVSPSGDGFRVRTSRGELRARSVVLTVPADEAAGILRETAPRTADELAKLRYNSLAVVHLISELDVRGYGFQLSLAEGSYDTRGVTFNQSLFGRPGVFTAYLGGALRPGVAEVSPGELAHRASQEFRRITGARARALNVHRVRIPAFDRSWRFLDEAREACDLPAGIHLCASFQIRPGIPGRVNRARSLAERLAGARRDQLPGDHRTGRSSNHPDSTDSQYPRT